MNVTRSHSDARMRLAGPDDLDAIASLTERAYRPYTESLGAPPLPVTEDYRPRIAVGGVWLMEVEEELAGLIVLEREADHLLIFSIVVAPRFQGRGMGQTLLRFADGVARQAGYGEIRLYTNALMARNIAIYEAYGYREAGRRPNPKRPGWTIVDMALQL